MRVFGSPHVFFLKDIFVLLRSKFLNDKENSMMFFTTPDGLRFDAGVQKDAVVFMPDQQPINLSWNTFWDVLTIKDSAGWSAEIIAGTGNCFQGNKTRQTSLYCTLRPYRI